MSLEQGLQGTLADLRWQPSHGCSRNCTALFSLEMEEKDIEDKLLQRCVLGYGFTSIYNDTSRRSDVADLMTLQTTRIKLIMLCHALLLAFCNETSHLHDKHL